MEIGEEKTIGIKVAKTGKVSITVGTRTGTAELLPSAAPDLTVGTRVRIERDETKYPSKGTWPQFRGRVGVVVEINGDRERPHLTEYGVVFNKEYTPGKRRPGNMAGSAVTWFKDYEMMRILAPDSNADSQQALTPIDGTQQYV